MSSNDKKQTVKQSGRGVPIWAWGLLAAVAAVIFFQRLEGKKEEPGEPARKIEDTVKNRGKILMLGNLDQESFDTEGTDPVKVDPSSEIAKLLDKNDEKAFVQALDREGINSVAVDTSIVNPATLPEVTLKTRMSLFKPMEQMHPVYLCPDYAIYTRSKPETVSDETGRALVTLARQILLGQNPSSSSVPAEALSKKKSTVAVSIQGLSPIVNENTTSTNWKQFRRDLYYKHDGESLYDAALGAARVIRERFIKGHEAREGRLETAMQRLQVEIEIFRKPTRVASLQGALSDREYDQYLWRAIEMGIHGVRGRTGEKDRYLLPSSAIYWSRPTVSYFLSRLGRILYGKEGENRYKFKTDPSLVLQRFRTFHFLELAPGGKIVRLRRSVPPVDMDYVTRDILTDRISWAVKWLTDNLNPRTNEFRYKYYPSQDIYLSEKNETMDKYNSVRHALAVYGMFMVYSELREKWVLDGAMQALKFITDRIVMGPDWHKPANARRLPKELKSHAFGPPAAGGGTGSADIWRGPDGRDLTIPGDMGYLRYDNNVKMGGNSGVVLALSELILVHEGAEKKRLMEYYRSVLEALGRFLVFMQKPDGSFYHYFVAPGHHFYNTTTTIYPGEIMFALARLYNLLGDQVYAETFRKAHYFYKNWFLEEIKKHRPDGTYEEARRIELVQAVPWISMAENEMYSMVRDPDYSDFGVFISEWMVDHFQFNDGRTFYPAYLGGYYKIDTEMPAMHGCVYTEGTAAAYNLARSAGYEDRAKAMGRSTLLGCRFAIQQIFVPGFNMHFLSHPERAAGGARYAINRTKLRIDYTYHTLSALVQALRYFDTGMLPEKRSE